MDMQTPDLAEFADGVFSSVKAYCDKRESALLEHMRAMLEALPKAEAGPPGRDGIDGKDGKDGAPGKDGVDGKDGVAGRDGVDGKDGAPGRDGVDGKDSTVPGPQGERGLPGEPGRDGLNGKDGAPGRDALQLDVLEAIDETRNYRRGTFAYHAGGLVRALRNTDPLEGKDFERAGWQLVVNGIADLSEEIITTTNGKLVRYRIKSDFMGDFNPKSEYKRGDMIRYKGSLWHCNATTSEPPGGETELWTLAIKGVRTDATAHYIGVVPKRKA